jgi:hypothetical protein
MSGILLEFVDPELAERVPVLHVLVREEAYEDEDDDEEDDKESDDDDDDNRDGYSE